MKVCLSVGLILILIAFCGLASAGVPDLYVANNAYWFQKIDGAGTTWDTLHDSATATTATANGMSAGIDTDDESTKWNYINRGVLTFNTTAVGDDATGTAVLFMKTGTILKTAGDWQFVIVNYTSSTFTTADYVSFGSTVIATSDNITDYSADTWVSIEIPMEYIIKNGTTRLGFLMIADKNDAPPTWSGSKTSSYSCYYSSEPKPFLSIDETAVIPDEINFQVGAADSAGDGLAGASVTLWYDGALQDTGTTTNEYPYDALFTVPNYTYVNGTVTLAGYQDGSYTYYKNYWDGWVTVTLYRTGEEIPNESAGMGNLILTFRDEETNEIIENVELNIYTDIDREDLFQNLYTTDGHLTTTIWKDFPYYFTAYAGGYWDSPFSYEISTTPEYYTVYLTPKSYTTIEPEIRVWVYSTYGQPIYNAYVSVSSSTDNGGGYTSGDGHYTYSDCAPIPVGSNRTYTIIASKGGYSSYTATTSVSTTSPTVTFYLTPTTNPNATATPTTVYTPVVTPEWSGTNGTPGNYKELFLNFTMFQFGVDAASASILIGLVITILCAVFVGGCLAGYGNGDGAGVGAMIGGVFGWVSSAMLGFIPIWAVIVTIALVAMIYFIFRSPSG